MTSMTAAGVQPVLADLIPRTRVRDVALVSSGVVFLAASSQVAIPLWFTPVPISLATFAVLLTGATLGPARAALTTSLFLLLGMVGAPIFAAHSAGWSFASFGYVLGYVPAAVVAGILARRRADRSALAMTATACLASLLIYAVGLPWLMAYLDVDLASGLRLGVYPFLVGDAVKALAAALLLPATWKIVDRFQDEPTSR